MFWMRTLTRWTDLVDSDQPLTEAYGWSKSNTIDVARGSAPAGHYGKAGGASEVTDR